MGGGFFSEVSSPYSVVPINLLTSGASQQDSHFQPLSPTGGDHTAARAINDIISGADWRAGQYNYYENLTRKTANRADFGLLRETVKRLIRTTGKVSYPGMSADNTDYVQGPYWHAAQTALEAVQLAKPGYLPLGPGHHEFGQTPKVALSDMINLLLSNTTVWGTGAVDTLSEAMAQHSNFSTLLTLAQGGLDVPVAPTNTFDWDAFEYTGNVTHNAVSAPSAASLGYTLPNEWGTDISVTPIAAPSEIDVSDHIDDAVSAFTALANLRWSADEAEIGASLFNTRQMLSTAFDKAQAILTANKQAQITEYDKSLRVQQTALQAQADMAYEQNLLARNTSNAQILLEVGKTNVTKFMQQEELALRRAESQLQAAIADKRNTLDANIANTQAALDAERIKQQYVASHMEASLRAGLGMVESAIRLFDSKTNTYTNILRVRSDLLRIIYDTVFHWMNAKSSLATNAGPLASVINNTNDLNIKGYLASREHEMQWRRDNVALATQWASAQEGIANLKWNALTQNIALYRDSIATMAGVPGGVHKPSGFQIAGQAVSGVMGLVSTGINLGMILS